MAATAALPRVLVNQSYYARVVRGATAEGDKAFLSEARAQGDLELLDRLADWHNPSGVRPEALLRNHRK